MSEQDPGPEYPKYPGEGSSEGGPPPPPPPPPPGGAAPPVTEQPGSIATAVKLMYAGAALSLLSVIASFFMLDSIKETIEESMREADTNVSQSTIDAAYAVGLVSTVVVGILAVGLWLWMAWKNGQGRSWARIVATIFGGLNVLTTLVGFTQPGMTAVSAIISAVTMVLAVIILILLWRKESTSYYEAVSQNQVLR
jgi:uncharacterized membrane protein (DUF2068 family)